MLGRPSRPVDRSSSLLSLLENMYTSGCGTHTRRHPIGAYYMFMFLVLDSSVRVRVHNIE